MDRGAWADYSPWGHKMDMTECRHAHTEGDKEVGDRDRERAGFMGTVDTILSKVYEKCKCELQVPCMAGKFWSYNTHIVYVYAYVWGTYRLRVTMLFCSDVNICEDTGSVYIFPLCWKWLFI